MRDVKELAKDRKSLGNNQKKKKNNNDKINIIDNPNE